MLMNSRNNIKSQKGFTLVELLVVIAIIGILAAIAVPKFTSATDSATKARIQADLRSIDSAIAQHYAATGVFATDIATLSPYFISTVKSGEQSFKYQDKKVIYGIDGGRAFATVEATAKSYYADWSEKT